MPAPRGREATSRCEASASSQPPASAWPSTAAISGLARSAGAVMPSGPPRSVDGNCPARCRLEVHARAERATGPGEDGTRGLGAASTRSITCSSSIGRGAGRSRCGRSGRLSVITGPVATLDQHRRRGRLGAARCRSGRTKARRRPPPAPPAERVPATMPVEQRRRASVAPSTRAPSGVSTLRIAARGSPSRSTRRSTLHDDRGRRTAPAPDGARRLAAPGRRERNRGRGGVAESDAEGVLGDVPAERRRQAVRRRVVAQHRHDRGRWRGSPYRCPGRRRTSSPPVTDSGRSGSSTGARARPAAICTAAGKQEYRSTRRTSSVPMPRGRRRLADGADRRRARRGRRARQTNHSSYAAAPACRKTHRSCGMPRGLGGRDAGDHDHRRPGRPAGWRTAAWDRACSSSGCRRRRRELLGVDASGCHA